MVYSNCRLHPVHMYGRLSVDPLRLRFHTCTLKEISCVIRAADFGTLHWRQKTPRGADIHRIPRGRIHRCSPAGKFFELFELYMKW